jgi:hypothetical protein
VILPDLSRRCPAVDPDDHHLYGSLGCATENLLVAAQAGGLRGHVSYDASESSVHAAFEKAAPSRSALFKAIPTTNSTGSRRGAATNALPFRSPLWSYARPSSTSLSPPFSPSRVLKVLKET